MSNGIYIAVSGSIAQMDRLDSISHELAQAKTTGFKRDIMSFESVRHVRPGTEVEVGDLADKDFVVARPTSVSLEQGGLMQTDNPLDVGLTGNGYFQIKTDQGVRLTRNGTFMLTRGGDLVTNQGHPVLGQGGSPIILPVNKSVSIDTEGNIRNADEVYGQFEFVGVSKGAQLKKDTAGHIIPSTERKDAAPLDVSFTVHQGKLEQSNVNPLQSMVSLMSVQRTFEALHQVISTYKQMDQAANRLTR
jgi:flagellar basal-body rod protein FlgF